MHLSVEHSELKLTKNDRMNRLHTLNLNAGIDHYSSASSDMIDPTTISSASIRETRYYPSASYSMRDDKKHYLVGASGYFSSEYDYTSFAPGLQFAKFSKDNNRELNIKLQSFFDNRQIILPIELRSTSLDFSQTKRNSYNSSIVYSQIVNERMQVSFLIDPSYQHGLLSTPFNRVYFADSSHTVQKLPDTRIQLPPGL